MTIHEAHESEAGAALSDARARAIDFRSAGMAAGVALAAALSLVLLAALNAANASAQIATLAFYASGSTAILAALGYWAGARFERIAHIAFTDSATVLANRHAFEAELAGAVTRAKSTAMPLSLLAIDVDRLKEINDTHGHAVGDGALRDVAAAIKRACRARDLVARWGGDEFMVLLTRTTAGEARVVADRIHDALVAHNRARDAARPELSVSIGVAELGSAAARSAGALFEAADEALLLAKDLGRGREAACANGDVSGDRLLDGSDPEPRAGFTVVGRADASPLRLERREDELELRASARIRVSPPRAAPAPIEKAAQSG